MLPDVPTAHEQGLTDFDASTWNGVFLPPRTPPEIVQRLNAAILEAMRTPAVQSRAQDIGASLVAADRRVARLFRVVRESRDREMGQEHPRRRDRRIDENRRLLG